MGLLLRGITTTSTMLAPLPEQVDFEDYRDVGGVKLPFTIRTSALAAFTTRTRRFTDIRLNVVANDSVFKMPAGQMDGRAREDVRPGLTVDIVLKQDQRTGRLTRGVVKHAA